MAFTVGRFALAGGGLTIGFFSLFGSGVMLMLGLFAMGLLLVPAAFFGKAPPARPFARALALVGGGLFGFVILWVARPFAENPAAAPAATRLLFTGGGWASYRTASGGGTIFEPLANTVMAYGLLVAGCLLVAAAWRLSRRATLKREPPLADA